MSANQANTLAVSWDWGGGAPGGTVAEKKTEGEVAVTSKRGNKIKKNASPDNPGIAIERSGNNVVKRANELNVEKKASGGGKSNGEKRKKEEEEPTVENDEGKEVKPGGKKQKKDDSKKEDEKKETKETKETNGDKKGRGRPKGAPGAKKEKKPAKPRATETISSRTRSQK